MFGYVGANTTLKQVMDSTVLDDKNSLGLIGGTNNTFRRKVFLLSLFLFLSKKKSTCCCKSKAKAPTPRFGRI